MRLNSRPQFKLIVTQAMNCLYMLSALFLVACGGNENLESCSVSSSSEVHPKFAKKPYNKPYEIRGVRYEPQPHYNIDEVGIASYYGGTDVFHGRKTSNGEIFDMNEISAAHKTAPIPCVLQITNLENGRTLKVKVNDRGPFIEGRIIDVSRRTAQLLGFYKQGTAKVHVKTLMPETMMLVQGHTDTIDPELTHNTLFAQNDRQGLGDSAKPVLRDPPSKQPITPQNHESILVALKDDMSEIYGKKSSSSIQTSIVQDVSLSGSKKIPFDDYVINTSSLQRLQTASAKSLKVNYPSNGGLFVQAGTFNHEKQAQKAKMLIQRSLKSLPVRLESISFNKKMLYRVVVGPCHNKLQAQKLANHIKTLNSSVKWNSIIIFNG